MATRLHSGSPPPNPPIRDFLRKDLDDELVRYKAVIDDPATPATKVEFITNTPEAQRYLTKYIRDKMGPDFPFEVKYVP